MRFYADLHIHSKYSRACSKDCDLEHLAWWAKRKGISVVGTGDVTHPAWYAHLEENLVPAEPGLFRLRPDLEAEVDRRLPPSCTGELRFMLSVEISTIYKRAERTRKIHHLIYLPHFHAATEFNTSLGKIGNLGSDGRPILGLDSRDLLEITLESGDGAYLVPAHIWTPWFSVLGSKAGFNAVEDCYLDLADQIFALETGLSADPEMIWRVSGLDRYTLVSHSDAHSPPMLGRECSRFDTDLDYYAIRQSLATGEGYLGSVEFFPEEGKYHLDGHRKCEVRLDPARTREYDGRCPECGKPVTVGVQHRVHELADRAEGVRPEGAAGFRSLIPLPEIMGEILGVGSKSKKVRGEIDALTATHGPELAILDEVPVRDLEPGSPQLAEAVRRLRDGEVIREAGYDGEYGTIRLFQPDELRQLRTGGAPALFDEGMFAPAAASRPEIQQHEVQPPELSQPGTSRQTNAEPGIPMLGTQGTPELEAPELEAPELEAPEPDGDGTGRETDGARAPAPAHAHAHAHDDGPGNEHPPLLTGLDPDQRAAAARESGPLLIVAGPGTGKTRTLTHRVAHLVTNHGIAPENCLAITFTRKAAGEMTERLHGLIGDRAAALTVTTFHSFGLNVLREHHERIGLGAGFGIADEERRTAVLTEVLGDERAARSALPHVSRARRGPATADADTAETLRSYLARLRELDLVDFDDLVALPVQLLESEPDLVTRYRDRYRWISVDEYQDVDELQYRLLRLLAPPDGNLTAIGDPDQAIYRFRGADVGFFLRFREDFPSAEVVQLTRNYRCGPHILNGAVRTVEPSTLVPGRVLLAEGVHAEPAKIGVHQAATETAEAAFVTRTIDQLLGGSSFHSLDSGRAVEDAAGGISFADIAVLYRTSAQSRALADALTRAGYPFQKLSHDRLVERPGVRELLSELSYAAPASTARDVPSRLRLAADAVLDRAPMSDRDGYAAELHSAVDLLGPLATRCADDVDLFRHELLLGAEVDALDPRADRISLLTLHAAKGLEFPVVFVAGCEDGLLPLRWPGQQQDADELAEERRLFFVGMTRAQRMLYLTHARQRTWRGQQQTCTPSPFLHSLDEATSEPVGAEEARRTPRARQLSLL